ncbi:MAG TPA: AraC family transcriptional regulator [Chthoniobacterales bacterium]|jgi:AraC family transcriptional regulator|nr:AraC family transcriptional regulator [Chthoniobacterales bacterium]
MKDPHSIPLWRTDEDLLPGNVHSRVVLSSVGTRWNDILVEQHNVPNCELADVTYKRQHVAAINIGRSTTWETKKEGRFQRFFKARGAISFFPSDQPFCGRLKVERDMFADVLFLALDPVFISRVAEGLEFDTERIELVRQGRSTDPTLHHIGMALRAGIQTGAALDRMYGEALSTALAVHLLRGYSAGVPGPKRQYGGLPREKLVRAVEYIKDQLNTDLTVSGIAQAVFMSPYHFTRLFKESTGQSPYQYVVEARVRKAKELLTTGKFTISEVAYDVGFVDQSHLTRHFKRIFGLPPRRLLEPQKTRDCGLRV